MFRPDGSFVTMITANPWPGLSPCVPGVRRQARLDGRLRIVWDFRRLPVSFGSLNEHCATSVADRFRITKSGGSAYEGQNAEMYEQG